MSIQRRIYLRRRRSSLYEEFYLKKRRRSSLQFYLQKNSRSRIHSRNIFLAPPSDYLIRNRMIFILFFLVLIISADHIPRQVLVTKYVQNVGPTNPTAFIDVGRVRLSSWNVLTSAQLAELDTTDRNFFYSKTGIDVSTGIENPPGTGIFYGPTWAYFPFELESDQRLDWIVADTKNPSRTNGNRRTNWIIADGGNTLAFTSNGIFSGGEWQGLNYYAGGIVVSEYVIMVPNVTISRWNRKYELHKCRTELEPAVQTANVYGQMDSIVTKSCIGVADNSHSTILVTNVYTNTSSSTRDERKTHAWTWSW